MANQESRAVALANNKGGVGKTSISINLADRLAKRGYEVLVIDTDPSGNLTEGVGLKDVFQNGTHFGQFLDDEEDDDVGFSDIIVPGEETGLPFDVMPSHEDLAQYQTRIDSKRMSMTWMDEQIIQPLLEQVYDFIVIDTEASPDSLWMDSAIYAAGNVIVPLDDGGESVSGFEMLRDRQIEPIRKHRDIDILALVPNETSNNNELRELVEDLEEQYPEYTPSFARTERFDDTVGPGIRDRVQIKRAWKDGIPLSEYDPDHEMIERFDVLADIVERGGVDG
jgi:chromosome partitioning protein